VTREMLKKNKNLYKRYLDWWFDKRKAFLIAMRNYLRNAGGIQDAVLLYTADHTESGKTHHAWGYKHHILTDDLDKWDDYNYPAFKLNDYIKKDWHLEAMLLPENTWGEWEWHHSVPPPDPDNYKDVEGVMMTYTFNKAYTVGSEKAFETFTTPSGLAMIRHYCLNEDGIEGTGYFVADIDWHGPYTVLAEARAMAYGNPRYMGYLASSAFNRAGLAYVRDFNANFLALPALPSTILEKASKNDDIVVREIPTDRHGTYLAVVNTALTNKKNVKISLPNRSDVQDATTGEYLYRNVNEIHLDMWPAQLASFILSAPLEE